ncbi:hypothetical protein B0H19DRAFT_1123716 [Mycena capillaripes]|nr:hypothetical protein B0H19DRAFT_1156411 [Mycena capillaripes]KAJ6574110.1 hypothetical protein B0H19DRAFT_1123716 [Mycena capillaripes]
MCWLTAYIDALTRIGSVLYSVSDILLILLLVSAARHPLRIFLPVELVCSVSLFLQAIASIPAVVPTADLEFRLDPLCTFEIRAQQPIHTATRI